MKHFVGNVSGNRHDGLVTRLGFGQFCDCLMSEISESKAGKWAFQF
jgi:hypothetical protein